MQKTITRSMRYILCLLLLGISNLLFGQQVNGVVLDEITKLPVANARVYTSDITILADQNGGFSLNNIRFGDTVTISHIGYQSYFFKHLVSRQDTIKILLKNNTIAVQEVVIQRKRNYTLDSLNRRKEYASVFNYKAPKFKDIFVNKYSSASNHYTPLQNSTSSLVSINLLSAIHLIGKNKTPESKLQKRLLKEEEESFLDQKFSKEMVQSITALEGDSLQSFMIQYRPTSEKSRQMTEYQMMVYIKESYGKFMKKDK